MFILTIVSYDEEFPVSARCKIKFIIISGCS